MKRTAAILFCFFIAAFSLRGQAVYSAKTDRHLTLAVGVEGSGFQPYSGSYSDSTTQYWSSHHVLMGEGIYVDMGFSRWLQFEVEGRMLQSDKHKSKQLPSTFHAFGEDSFLAGPRVPLRTFGRVTPYAKALVGVAYSTGVANYASWTGGVAYAFSTQTTVFALAGGGGIDYRLSRHFVVRPIDFEWQSWRQQIQTPLSAPPNYTIHPYGVSAGFAYRF